MRAAAVALWAVPLALGGALAFVLTRPERSPPPLPPPKSIGPAPAPRKLHDVDLTVVRAADEAALASTSGEIKPQPANPDDVLFLVATPATPRPLRARAFLVSAEGAVRPISPELLTWGPPPDGGTYPVHRLPNEGLRGDYRVVAFVSFDPFELTAADVERAIRSRGRPLDPRPLGLPPPSGAAGATFAEVSLTVHSPR